ncbi:C-C chemokine receptor type 1-like [Asterias rubens]|uniref:C-C chemokine receptor type 1-like n=1 Tax=Asterias rubens TaxID=7604 RepID=UPI0014553C5B|nr:C-C chemokine receptor type 1-like [Asterias rubens]
MAFNIPCEDDFIENYTDPTTADRTLYTTGTATIVGILMPCILIFGVVNNLFFLVGVFRVKRMRTVTNHYLVQLAVTDILYLPFAAGERILRFTMSPIVYDKGSEGLIFGCIIIPFFRSLGYFASLFFITLVTLEMFLAICKPIKHMVLNSRGLTLKLTCGVWGSASFFACVLITSFCILEHYCVIWPAAETYQHLPTIAASCEPVSQWANEAHNIIQSAPFYIGLVVDITLYL